MPVTIFVNPIAGDIAVEWTCEPTALIARLNQLMQNGWRFFPAEQIGQVVGEVAPEGVRIKDRDISDLVKERLVRVVDVQGAWEAKTADAMTAEETAGADTIAIRGPAARSIQPAYYQRGARHQQHQPRRSRPARSSGSDGASCALSNSRTKITCLELISGTQP
jgi:hypothetical protein